MGSPNAPSKCEGNFYHQNDIKSHWTQDCCPIYNMISL